MGTLESGLWSGITNYILTPPYFFCKWFSEKNACYLFHHTVHPTNWLQKGSVFTCFTSPPSFCLWEDVIHIKKTEREGESERERERAVHALVLRCFIQSSSSSSCVKDAGCYWRTITLDLHSNVHFSTSLG